MLTAAPQAIVFDFGDVLTTKPNTEEIRQFLRSSFHLNKEEFKGREEGGRGQTCKEGVRPASLQDWTGGNMVNLQTCRSDPFLFSLYPCI